jgi:hypothetical protein
MPFVVILSRGLEIPLTLPPSERSDAIVPDEDGPHAQSDARPAPTPDLSKERVFPSAHEGATKRAAPLPASTLAEGRAAEHRARTLR